ncbi:amino acid transporter [Lichtheimia hyalospora FSU 10163]|nr:amino acid transporter [Lichtheimia hyalospora FSU 10163]
MLICGICIGSGIFSAPAGILMSVGSVGMSLVMWVIGAIYSIIGVMAFIELGAMLPRSGGEKEYLNYAYRKPKRLAPFMFTMSYMILTNTSSSSADAHATASYLLLAAGAKNVNPWLERGIGVAINTSICLLHAWSAKWGLRINNTMSCIKIIMLIFVCLTGLIAAAGGISGVTPTNAFSNAFEGTVKSGNEYAAAMLKVIYAYSGWNNATYIMDELKNPIRTLKVSSLSAMSLLATLFMIANIAYFSVVPKEVFLGGAEGSSTNTIAGEFLVRIFGEKANIVMPLLIALSTFGCTSSMTYSGSRVMLEAAKEGYIPFSHFFGRVSSRHTPANILLLYWAVTMFYNLAIPPGDAYNFVLDLCSYPMSIFSCLTIIGLMYLRYREPETPRPFRSWLPLNVIFVLISIFMAVAPFIPPVISDTPSIPYWVYPTAALGFLFCCIPLWHFRINVHRGLSRSL